MKCCQTPATAEPAKPSCCGGHEPAKLGQFTCPMHPEIEQDHPGDCPKCGMPLESRVGSNTADDHAQHEIRNLSQKFWIGLILLS